MIHLGYVACVKGVESVRTDAMIDLQKILTDHKSWLLDGNGHLADLSEADLRRADLREANLREAKLLRANLSEAKLSGADLNWADLREAKLLRADLSGVTFCGATIDGAVLQPEDIGGPGWILCALTDLEWSTIEAARKNLLTASHHV